MATMEDDYVPIEMDSNGDEEVAEIDSMHVQKKTNTIQAGTYKPVVDGKPLKCQRKLTSNFWEHYEFLRPSKDGNLFCKCKKYGQVYPGDSKNGTGNLKRHLSICNIVHFSVFLRKISGYHDISTVGSCDVARQLMKLANNDESRIILHEDMYLMMAFLWACGSVDEAKKSGRGDYK
ncbi:hypothetical protein Cgig2_002683 [Carnegiea gigantea]|uniref:BED-type domain-containing protein n=1 Tax=Carnegiea gigantea TaxID=171969 RepID=A0A9Q1JP90_9CARY|nr:hypothetical protein Cgig2_002683 [Carnegiea gigantea]